MAEMETYTVSPLHDLPALDCHPRGHCRHNCLLWQCPRQIVRCVPSNRPPILTLGPYGSRHEMLIIIGAAVWRTLV